MEGGGEEGECVYIYIYIYICRYTVTTRIIPALRRAAMRAILMFHNCEGQCHKKVSTDHNFSRERRAKADSNRGPSAYQPNTLPLGQTGSQRVPPKFSILYAHQCLLLTVLSAEGVTGDAGVGVVMRKNLYC